MKKWIVYILAGYMGLALPVWLRLYLDSRQIAAEPVTGAYTTETQTAHSPPEPQAVRVDAVPDTAVEEAPDEYIDVFMADEKTVCTMSLREYIIGVVAAEMPASWHTGALCAQALAALNYARRSMECGSREYLGGGVISTDSAVNQGYYDEADMRNLWGEDYAYYRERIAAAVDTVLPYRLMYDGELCLTCYHAISSGKTECSENVFNTSVDYLTAVDSAFDAGAPGYRTQLTVTESEFREKCGLPAGCILPGDAEYTPSGTLLTLTAGGITVSGAAVQTAFGLRSRAVVCTCEDGSVTMTVYGYGHGVGMSQYGAQYLAGQGYTWQEILAYYYPGTELLAVS